MPNLRTWTGDEEKIREFAAKPPKLEQVDTEETERIMAGLINEDPAITAYFAPSFFDKVQALRAKG